MPKKEEAVKEQPPEIENKELPDEKIKLVEVGSLEPLQLFEFEGHRYSRRRIHSGGVTALSSEMDKVVTVPHDTKVKIVH